MPVISYEDYIIDNEANQDPFAMEENNFINEITALSSMIIGGSIANDRSIKDRLLEAIDRGKRLYSSINSDAAEDNGDTIIDLIDDPVTDLVRRTDALVERTNQLLNENSGNMNGGNMNGGNNPQLNRSDGSYSKATRKTKSKKSDSANVIIPRKQPPKQPIKTLNKIDTVVEITMKYTSQEIYAKGMMVDLGYLLTLFVHVIRSTYGIDLLEQPDDYTLGKKIRLYIDEVCYVDIPATAQMQEISVYIEQLIYAFNKHSNPNKWRKRATLLRKDGIHYYRS